MAKKALRFRYSLQLEKDPIRPSLYLKRTAMRGCTYYDANLMNFRSSCTRLPGLGVKQISVTIQY